MDKHLVLAVAGSGKTTHIINSLNLETRFLIITYTINNTRHISNSIISKFGYFPDNIDLFTYFNFLYSFCFSPFLSFELKAKGLYWDIPPDYTRTFKRSNIQYYKTNEGRLYYNRLALLLKEKGIIHNIIQRIEKYYDCLLIDEIQDFGGHDFNLIGSLAAADIRIIMVGDFYQHTFDTSRDGKTNESLHTDFHKYINRFKEIGVNIDLERLNKSYRCSPELCKFISNNLGITINSHRSDNTKIKLIVEPEEINAVFNNHKIVKLYYQGSGCYSGYTKNWGECKGEDCYSDVCVVLNKTSYDLYKKEQLHKSAPSTKNKLYVACSRARNDLYFIPEILLKNHKK